MKRKIVTGLLVALMVCSVAGCGKSKASSSAQGSSVVEQSSQAAQSAAAQGSQVQGSQSAEASNAQSSQSAEASSAQGSQSAEASTAQTAEKVSAAISLDEDMASVSYVLLARMISEHEGNAAYDAVEQTNGDTFWKEMNYLVSAYGVNNKRISFDENTKNYTVKKAQLRFYAAALYSDLGKAKKLPQIADGSTSVEKSGSKWQFAMNDTSSYDIAVQSCEKQDDGTFKITAYLTDASSSTSLGEYTAFIKKSPYKSKKSPFHYTVVSLDKMTKMPLETVLVGNTSDTQTQDASTQTAGTTDTAQTAGTDSTGSAATGTTNTTGTQYGTVLSMPGTTSGTDTAQSAGTTGTTASTDQTAAADTQTTGTADTSASQTAGTDTSSSQTTGTDNTIAGATVTSDAAMEIAKKYYGASSSDGKEYTYKFEGTTSYQNVPYYNFSVSDGTNTVINILVSGDGARVYKGTNTNGSWTMQ